MPGSEDPVPASLLTDLYASRLIITDDYVGPERRPVTRDSEDGGPEQPPRRSRFPRHPRRSGGAPSLRPWHLVAAVALTTLIVAPLTLELSRPPAPGTPSRPSPAADRHRPRPRPRTRARPPPRTPALPATTDRRGRPRGSAPGADPPLAKAQLPRGASTDGFRSVRNLPIK